jgi:chemotaxis signal transduction protein
MNSSVVFCIDDLTLKLPLQVVQEIVQAPEIVRVPAAAADMIGWINVRGDLVAVFDLRKRLGLSQREERPQDVLVLVTQGSENIAILADDVIGLIEEDNESGNRDQKYETDCEHPVITVERNEEILSSVPLSSLCASALFPAHR